MTKTNEENETGDVVTRSPVPSKRFGAPAVDVVKMDAVPPPPLNGRTGIADQLYAQICTLKAGSALRAQFEASQHGDYVRGKLRSKAKADGQFVSSSRSVDGLTRYFWLEKI